MKISSSMNGDVAVLDMDGDMKTPEDMGIFLNAIDGELAGNRKNILLNFQKVKFINSTGLGRLVLALKRVTEQSGSLGAMNLTNDLDELFTFTRLNKKISVYKNEEEALEGFKIEHT